MIGSALEGFSDYKSKQWLLVTKNLLSHCTWYYKSFQSDDVMLAFLRRELALPPPPPPPTPTPTPQAAGRMRLLGRGQKLQFVGTQEVSEKIQRGVSSSSSSSSNSNSPSPLTSHHVLQWVMANTCASMTEGVMEWCKKGMHFASTKAQAGQPLLQEEQHDLEQLYSPAQIERPVKEQVHQLAEQLVLKPHPVQQAEQIQEHNPQQQQQQQQQQALLQVPGLLSKI
eukprot:1147904-Pelagomonas_calceolata.AAC.3